MANEESLSRAGAILTPQVRARIVERANDPEGPVGRALARAGVPPSEIEAGLAGHPMPSAAFAEAAGGGGSRNGLLEAIIMRVGRPSYLIVGNRVDWSTGEPFEVDIHAEVEALRPSYLAVGRVEVVNHPQLDWLGTAWLVEGPDGPIVITNRHVAAEFSVVRPDGRVVMRSDPSTMVGMGASVDFRCEFATPDSHEVAVRRVRYLARPNDPDLAILELEPNAHLAPAFALAEREARRDDLIVTVGYPARDFRNAADTQHDIFRDSFDMKRLAPGRIMQAAGPGREFRHDASTLGGASGSPIIDLSSRRVVGLHFSGRYLDHNAAVSVASIEAALAGRVMAVPEAYAAVEGEGRADGSNAAPHFDGRAGYSPGFLVEALPGAPAGLHVALPSVPSDGLAELVGRPGEHELRYTHFSVVYHAARRCPRMTAVNIDGSKAVKIVRGTDRWFKDLRIDPAVQLGSGDFAGDFDRGHMVRREDPNWGTEAVARIADSDTFHYTNAALQHALLNRSRERWLGLEEYILRSAKTHGFRASVFAGPVLADGDPSPTGRPDLQVPKAFWKVVVMIAADGAGLHATGYVLGQAAFVQSITESRFQYGDFNLFQVPIARITAATGIDFGGIAAADPLAGTADAESPSAGVVLLERLDQLVL